MENQKPGGRRRALLAGVAVLAVIGAAAAAYLTSPVPRQAATTPAPALGQHLASAVERGEYVARAADCAPCHTAPDGQPFAGGLILKTPFGEMASPNITPDPATGIGGWSREQFARAVREGMAPGLGELYPTMSYTSYTKMSDADIDALYAYLMSLDPVRAPRAAVALDFPFDQRWLLKGWRKLFFDNAEFQPDPSATDQVNRGAYLVQGPAHCAECHSPRTVFGAIDEDLRLAGGQIDGYWAPNLTPDPDTGLAAWSEADLYAYLSGTGAPHGGAFGPMHDVVAEGTSHLTEDDLRAMAAYLARLAPVANASGEAMAHAQAQASIARGKDAFQANCAACHRDSGAGVPDFAPALAGHHALRASADNIVMPILTGLSDREGVVAMPAFLLPDETIADIANYVRGAIGGAHAATATAEQVAAARARLD